MSWILSHLDVILPVVAVLLAMLYTIAEGTALQHAARLWGLVAVMARDVLATIPENAFEEWAALLYSLLPAWAVIFISKGWIKSILMKWRDELVSHLVLAPVSQKKRDAEAQEWKDLHDTILIELETMLAA
jgi:hypothetical protein